MENGNEYDQWKKYKKQINEQSRLPVNFDVVRRYIHSQIRCRAACGSNDYVTGASLAFVSAYRRNLELTQYLPSTLRRSLFNDVTHFPVEV